MAGLEDIQILWLLRAADKILSFCSCKEFRFSGWAGGNSDLVAAPRSGEKIEFLQSEGIQI